MARTITTEPRTDQLRVRLYRQERQQLETALRARGKNETISDLIREALAWCLDPSGKRRHPVYLSDEAHEALLQLATALRRDPNLTADECIRGILTAAEGHVPLVVEEFRLQRRYAAEEKTPVPDRRRTVRRRATATLAAGVAALALLLLPGIAAAGTGGLTTATVRDPATGQRVQVTQVRTYAGGDQRAVTRDPNTARITGVTETRAWRDGSQTVRHRDPVTGRIQATETRR